MKKIVNSKIFIFVIALIIGASVSIYAANTYNSNSILYTTSDGESMSVNDALNDLYGNTCSLTNEEYIFDYTGDEQIFIVPKTGTYKLEVWGAQGGSYNSTYYGGYGSYSAGEVELKEGDNLYINVGGTTNSRTGGYNGGGNGHVVNGNGAYSFYGGGGATHIALKSGLLSTLSSSIDDILIVAGGGGGLYAFGNGYYANGGNAGGYIGNAGSATKNSTAKGGSQTGGGIGNNNNSNYSGKFGQGGNGGSSGTLLGTGGGGGFYGGGGTYNIGSSAESAGGGSGYIGNSLLTNKFMSCYNCTVSASANIFTISFPCATETPTTYCSKQGNGYAKITYLGK